MQKDMFERRVREVTVTISNDKCTGCGKCVDKCRHGVMHLRARDDKRWAWLAFPEKCTGCGRCEKACPSYAIMLIDVTGIAMGNPVIR